MGILTVDVGTKHTVASVRRHPNATGGERRCGQGGRGRVRNRASLVVDTVSALCSVGSNEGGVVLVQNDMSKLETPTHELLANLLRLDPRICTGQTEVLSTILSHAKKKNGHLTSGLPGPHGWDDARQGVAFRGNRIEVGEMAALQPASNAANTVTQFVGYTGLDHEDLASYPIQPIFNTDSGASSNTVSGKLPSRAECANAKG
eukprot:3934813-Rhodomonas_salina.1